MNDLAEFLLARIAEREIVAKDMQEQAARGRPFFDVGRLAGGTGIRELIDPVRVLAECEANRRIVERCRPRWLILYRESERLLAEAFDQTEVHTEAHSGPIWMFEGAEEILQDLALPYADHADYREEWRP